MAKRKSLTKKTRFEVFKRDSFKCQYCGKSAPDVVLNVDHIKPVAEGGDNEITNLITSCFDCNMGKKDRMIDDNSVLEKQRKQLEDLNERRIQLEMMLEWREALERLNEEKESAIGWKWSSLVEGYQLNEAGLQNIKKMIRKFDMNLIMDCMEISVAQYCVVGEDGKFTHESVNKAWNYVPKIANNKQKEEERPYLKDLYYMRGILNNRLSYYDSNKTIPLLEKAYLNGASLEWLKELCLEAPHWTYFRTSLEQYWEEEQ